MLFRSLDKGSKGDEGEFAPAFIKAMAKLDYVEGKNIAYEYGYANLDFTRFGPVAAEMVRTRPDAIVAPGTPWVNALLRETSSIPIVTTTGDPVGNGFAKSLARPGRNVTGLSGAYPEAAMKSIELLTALFPGRWKLAVVGEAGHPYEFSNRVMEEAARRNGIQTIRMTLRDKGEVERAFASMRSRGIRLVTVPGVLPGYDDRALFALTTASGLAMVSTSNDHVARGVLLGYEAQHGDTEMRMAVQLDKILHGIPVGDIPFELPTTFRLSINMKTARALGITISRELMLRAEKVYE